jgi:putative hydrolase of HD superfamily
MEMMRFFAEVDNLKRVRRSGWLERGVEAPESSADHSFAVALQALVLGYGRTDLDMCRVLKMALVHDLAECVVGDIIAKESWPKGGFMTAKEKHALERKALARLLSHLPAKCAQEIKDVWKEFERGETKEAIFVKSVDRFETIFQALQYATAGKCKTSLSDFWNKTAISSIRDAEVRKVLLHLLKRARRSSIAVSRVVSEV